MPCGASQSRASRPSVTSSAAAACRCDTRPTSRSGACHPNLVMADVHEHRVCVAHARKRRAHRRVEVDVRRPPGRRGLVQQIGIDVEPRVHAGAGGERLEPQPVDVARHDGVGGEDPCSAHLRWLVVARACDFGDGEQRLRRLLRAAEEAGEEVGVGLRPAGRGERQLGAAILDRNARLREIGVGLRRRPWSGYE